MSHHGDAHATTANFVTKMAENSDPKRTRKANFSPAECALIFEEVMANAHIIKAKFSNTFTNKNKS